MDTKNYLVDQDGLMVASGPGFVTFTPDTDVFWAIGLTTDVPDIQVRHTTDRMTNETGQLEAGQYLFIWPRHNTSQSTVAVSAANPAPNSI